MSVREIYDVNFLDNMTKIFDDQFLTFFNSLKITALSQVKRLLVNTGLCSHYNHTNA